MHARGGDVLVWQRKPMCGAPPASARQMGTAEHSPRMSVMNSGAWAQKTMEFFELIDSEATEECL